MNDNSYVIDGIEISENLVNFYDLCLYNSVDKQSFCYYYHHNTFLYYDRNLGLDHGTSSMHLLEDFEVYHIIRKF